MSSGSWSRDPILRSASSAAAARFRAALDLRIHAGRTPLHRTFIGHVGESRLALGPFPGQSVKALAETKCQRIS
jgi:hypothetical protein